jgi:raffinose/stachyose/melibiose transport system substrate-binding protein
MASEFTRVNSLHLAIYPGKVPDAAEVVRIHIPKDMTMTSRITRRLLAAGTVVAVAAALAACSGSGGSSSDPVTLEFQTGQAVDSPLLASLKTVTAAFEKQNPGIHIDLKTGGDSFEQDMKVRLAAHNPPDMWSTHGWSLARYSPFLEPLNTQPWAKNFNAVLAPAMKNKQGQFFALPITTAASGLIINETVLQKAGVDESTLSTWSGLTAAADKVKASGVVPFQLAGSKDGSAGNVIDWLAPGAFTDAQLAGFQKGQFQDAAYQKLLDVVAQMKSSGWTNVDYTSATYDDMAKALAQDKTAFALSGNQLINAAWQYAPDAKLTYIPVPAIDGDPAYLIGGEDAAIGISKTGKHVDDAEKYLAFVAQPENITALSKSVGSPPGLSNATADLGKLTQPYEDYVKSGKVDLKPFFDRVYLPNGMWATVVSTADGIVAGQSDPAAGTQKMASDFATLYKQSSN